MRQRVDRETRAESPRLSRQRSTDEAVANGAVPSTSPSEQHDALIRSVRMSQRIQDSTSRFYDVSRK